jgi:hypothetical protein
MYQGSLRDVHQAAAVVQPRFNPHRHRKRQSDIGWNRRGFMFSDGSSATGESSIVGVERETKSRCVPFACGEAETFDHNLYPRRPQVAPGQPKFSPTAPYNSTDREWHLAGDHCQDVPPGVSPYRPPIEIKALSVAVHGRLASTTMARRLD